MTTTIYNVNGTLAFNGDQVASVKEYMEADRCVGSIFEVLEAGEEVILQEGTFIIDEDLDVND